MKHVTFRQRPFGISLECARCGAVEHVPGSFGELADLLADLKKFDDMHRDCKEPKREEED